jgi:UPF0755 protein
MSMIRTLRNLSLLMLLLAVGAVGWFAWYVLTPMRSAGVSYPLAFEIERGASLKQAAGAMHDAGVLAQDWAFVLLARALGRSGDIKAGNYGLEAPLTPLQLLRKITAGDTLLARVTIIEGWTFADMRRALAAHPALRQDAARLDERELLAALGSDAERAEGLFFPDTYFFDQGSSDLAVYRRAYAAMQAHLDKEWQARQPGLPYRTPYEALIMASIIEKETGAAEERRLIASVFVNRLRLGMRLQTDPTVIYGMGEAYQGNLRRVDLQTDTPYNTYTRGGLTPTPIALPGLDSLRAALDPEASRMLYFVSKGNGRHEFSETLDAHNRAVWRYQRGGGSR